MWMDNYSPDPPKEKKQLAEIVSLDRMPSPTPPIIGHVGDFDDVICVLPVHGLGALTFRCTLNDSDKETGRMSFKGVGLFTSEEIRPSCRSEKDI